ncbi:MAG: molybdopterin molybdotransferase MoeA [Acidobacteria bacterium]|jgi:molybdenum cofactor synthesis domain-containing protein|nr:molybdopterin molybdotransferase MoeA [Acidobacteriota bacterium]
MITVDEALEIVLRETPALPTEEVMLGDALGRVLAEDIRSDTDMPPFDRAAMDGYALRAADVASCPARLSVTGEVAAGAWPDREVGAGEAIRIMTGAPVPAGATAVQQVERTRPLEDGHRVEILAPVADGANVSPRGCEVREGDVVLERGRLISAAAAAVLAATGHARVRVGRRPRVAVLVTGDEIVDVTARPTPGQIRNSNGPAVAAQARRAGATVRDLGVVADRRDETVAALRDGLSADVLVVSGGVSAGDYDLVEPALEELGVAFLFTRVAIKPGAPLVFGRRDATLVFGLPGNPVSAQVTFDLFVRAALLRLQGARLVLRPRVEVELLSPLKNRSGRRAHLPTRVRFEGGRLVARAIRSMGSGDLVAHARANALAVLEAERTQAEAGETAEAVLLDGFLEDDGAPP